MTTPAAASLLPLTFEQQCRCEAIAYGYETQVLEVRGIAELAMQEGIAIGRACVVRALAGQATAHGSLVAALARLFVGVTGQSTTSCEWYEGILADATDEAYVALAASEQS